MFMNKSKAFTLIEMMIVVAIVAILAAVAYPSYANYSFRARRADGHEILMRIASAQERHYTNRNAYTATLADLGFSSGASEKSHYTVAATVANSDQTYILTATPSGIQAADSCKELEITSTGAKTAPNDTGKNGKCW